MKNVVGAILAILVIGGAWYAGSHKQEARTAPSKSVETVKVKIADLPVADGWPLYVAIEKGYFKEAGIDVERVRLDAPNLIIDALLSGQVDMGSPSTALGITALGDLKKPGTLQIYAIAGGNVQTHPSDILAVEKDSPIKSLSDLRGKRVGVLPGIQWRTISRHVFGQVGLEVDKGITLVELAPGLQVTALASGQVDALLAIEPTLTIAEVKGVGKELVHGPVIQALDTDAFYGGAGVIRTQFIREHPETAKKILEIMARAIEDIRRDPDTMRPYLRGYTALDDDELIAKVPVPVFKMYDEITTEDKEAVQKFYDIFTLYKVAEKPLVFEKLLYKK